MLLFSKYSNPYDNDISTLAIQTERRTDDLGSLAMTIRTRTALLRTVKIPVGDRDANEASKVRDRAWTHNMRPRPRKL